MNYYNEIKKELINNEIIKRVKEYSKNRSDLKTYYNVGKLLANAGKHYGEGIIKEYSKKLTIELDKKYSMTSLKYMRSFYLIFEKSQPLVDQLTWSHYVELLPLKDINKINYYIKVTTERNLSKRELRVRIKNKEYERLDEKTKEKLKKEEKEEVTDLIKEPILIKNTNHYEEITEKVLKQLILEDISSFMKELGRIFFY